MITVNDALPSKFSFLAFTHLWNRNKKLASCIKRWRFPTQPRQPKHLVAQSDWLKQIFPRQIAPSYLYIMEHLLPIVRNETAKIKSQRKELHCSQRRVGMNGRTLRHGSQITAKAHARSTRTSSPISVRSFWRRHSFRPRERRIQRHSHLSSAAGIKPTHTRQENQLTRLVTNTHANAAQSPVFKAVHTLPPYSLNQPK